jgi:septal ring factor EnvC (AmiA/AmiB activator)
MAHVDCGSCGHKHQVAKCSRCNCCDLFNGMPPVALADADRIAQLTAELAEAREEIEAQASSYVRAGELLRAERAAHERTKAELAKASTERGATLAAIRSANAEVVAAQDEAAALSKRVAELEAILGRQ